MSTGTQISCSFCFTNNWGQQAKITVQHFKSSSGGDPDAQFTDILPQGSTSQIIRLNKFTGDPDYWTIYVVPYPYGTGDSYGCTRDRADYTATDNQLAVFTVAGPQKVARVLTPVSTYTLDLDKLNT